MLGNYLVDVPRQPPYLIGRQAGVQHVIIAPMRSDKPKDDDSYSAEESAKRMGATVRAMIATPPAPRRKPDKASTRRPSKKARHKKG